MLFEDVERSATFSECRRYRYRLSRVWDPDLELAAWVMLNPSVADHLTDDPTIRRCVSFARRWGCGGIVVCNLYSLIATDPKVMLADPDPIGPETGKHLAFALSNRFVVAAWGSNADPFRAASFVQMAKESGVSVHCLGKNADGSPRHPLYIPSQKALEAYP